MALLEVTNLSHTFGGLQALADFNLTLHHGELVGLIGPNGAGKTTVFNLLSGVYRPDQGRIVFAGQEITLWPSYRRMAAGLSRTFQNIRLFKDMSVLDNVRLGAFAQYDYSFWQIIGRTAAFRRQERRLTEEAMAMLARFGLAEAAQTPARHLPYGEQRRLEIARALISRPKILLLDEPAAGMNQAETLDLVALLRDLHREFDLTILLIEHHMGVVLELCQRVLVLDFGSTIFAGDPQAAQKHPLVLEAYLGKEENGHAAPS
ncbi:MAG: ABC transporter ATP-binding protein [Desulfobacca sp.]|uniref:ABC transporter ATP-binding protein n=1 Tax=Desulfobacca sp. TaxID=2067990 RepID=UPI00404A5F47